MKNENQNLKEKLSEVLNQNFNLTGQETFTVEDPNPTFESTAPDSQAPPSGKMNLVELEEELLKAKDENEELVSKNQLLEDQVDDLNYQIKKLKKVSHLRKIRKNDFEIFPLSVVPFLYSTTLTICFSGLVPPIRRYAKMVRKGCDRDRNWTILVFASRARPLSQSFRAILGSASYCIRLKYSVICLIGV